jgi:ubiquinone/menaquinone biosynthesis C-methylase UbiE
MIGLDLSPNMVAAARLAHPTLPFGAGDAAALPFRTRAVGGLVSWYSLINMPTSGLPEVLDGFAHVMAAQAPLLLAFQSGQGERVDRPSAYGRRLTMTYFLHRAETVAAAVTDAGFSLYATVDRQPALPHETTTQSFVLARRAA